MKTTILPKLNSHKRKRLYVSIIALVLLSITLFGISIVLHLRSINHTSPQISLENVVPSPVLEYLKVFSGNATIDRSATTLSATINQNQTIFEGDIIKTQDHTVAVIYIDPDNQTRLGPNTSVQIISNGMSLKLNQKIGSIHIRFTKILGKYEDYSVETPTVVATVRGTKFAVFTSSESSKIVALDHEIELYKKDPLTQQVIVEPLNRVSINTYALMNSHINDILMFNLNNPNSQYPISYDETQWLQFNQQLDSQAESVNITALSTQLFTSPTPTPSPTATPIPTPTIAPKPASPIISTMPSEGYSRSLVKTDEGDFTLSCIGGNKNSTRVVTDSANEQDCKNNCPVLPLHEFAQKNGGFAAMNGMYFCPADYASCDGKKNSFDTLFFNSRVKRYINSDNNVYSVLPFLVIESSGNARYVAKTQEWGRDTGIQAGTAGNPLLMHNGSYVAESQPLDDKQRNVKSNRGALVQNGDLLYLCIVSGATVPDSGKVYKSLNVNNAMNIDGGGSTALWLNGSYIYGPGRNIPTAIIFAKK